MSPVSGGSRYRIGHVVASAAYGSRRRLACSCGHVIEGTASDQEQGRAFERHRREAPPEPPERRPVSVGPSTSHLATDSVIERVKGW